MSVEDELKDELKEAWKNLDEEDRKGYVRRAKVKTKKRDRASLLRAAVGLFKGDYEIEIQKSEYQNGAEGLIKWAEENVRVNLKRGKEPWVLLGELPDEQDEFGRSPKSLWEKQKVELRVALEMDEHGVFKRNLIIWCHPRGEGKSFLTILIVIWRFFNFPFFKASLSANSKDQSDHMHFSEIKEIIQNSPALNEIVGEKGIVEREVRITRGKKGRFNLIKQLSTGSGLVSNTNMVTQSEAFQMPDKAFFVQWYGSLRNTPNALGIIDTTVSTKDHWIYELYKSYLNDPDGVVYFSYRCNRGALPDGYWHPGMTERQIKGYRGTFTAVEFAMYYENLWDTEEVKLLSEVDIQAIGYIGIDGSVGGDDLIREVLLRHNKLVSQESKIGKRFQNSSVGYSAADPRRFAEVSDRLMNIDDYINLGEQAPVDHATSVRGTGKKASLADLERLGKLYNTHWAIICGIDKSDPMKYTKRLSARTAVCWLAKGLPDSMNSNRRELNKADLDYMYVQLGTAIVDNSMDLGIQVILKHVQTAFGSIEMVTGEMFGMIGIKTWCDQNEIPFQAWNSSLERQRVGYSALISAITTGRFKSPSIPVQGSRESDIFREELKYLDVDSTGKVPKYGSVEKHKQGGVQDDVIDADIWALYGGLSITAAQFKPRQRRSSFYGGLYADMPLVKDIMAQLYS